MTHADLCPGRVSITMRLSPDEVRGAFDESTGIVLSEVIIDSASTGSPPQSSWATVPSSGRVCLAGAQAGGHARMLARMAFLTVMLRPDARQFT